MLNKRARSYLDELFVRVRLNFVFVGTFLCQLQSGNGYLTQSGLFFYFGSSLEDPFLFLFFTF